MRIPFRPRSIGVVVLFLACLVTLGASALEAGDEDPLEALARGLLAEQGPERARAEAALARADADSLRALVGRLRERLGVAHVPPAAAQLEPKAPDGPVVLLETRIVEVPASMAEELVGLGRVGSDGTRCYDRDALETLLGALGKSSKAKVISAPSIATALGEKAQITVMEQTSFVRDFELVGTRGTWMADPVIGVVQQGVSLELTASLLGEELSVTVALDLSALSSPMAQWTGPLVKGLPDVTLGLPEVTTTRWSRRVLAPKGRPILLAALPSPSGGADARALVFLEGTLLEPDAVAGPAAGPAAGK